MPANVQLSAAAGALGLLGDVLAPPIVVVMSRGGCLGAARTREGLWDGEEYGLLPSARWDSP